MNNLATQNYNEDYVLEQLLNEEEHSNFFGRRHHEKKQAKIELKNNLREKYGKGWWLPGKLHKYRKDYKAKKHEVITKALEKASQENFEEREAKKKAKSERKDERKQEQANQDFQTQLQQQLTLQQLQQEQMQAGQNQINTQRLEENKPKEKTKTKTEADKKKKQTMIIGGSVGGLLLVGLILFLVFRNKE